MKDVFLNNSVMIISAWIVTRFVGRSKSIALFVAVLMALIITIVVDTQPLWRDKIPLSYFMGKNFYSLVAAMAPYCIFFIIYATVYAFKYGYDD